MKFPDAMRAKGYSNAKATDQILIQQVRCEARKIKGGDVPHPKSAAASSGSRCGREEEEGGEESTRNHVVLQDPLQNQQMT